MACSGEIKKAVKNYYNLQTTTTTKLLKEIIKEIKQIFGISERTFYYWKKEFMENKEVNVEKIMYTSTISFTTNDFEINCVNKTYEHKNNIGRPKNSGKITKEIEDYVLKHYKNELFSTVKNVISKINKKFNIKVTKSTIYRILHKNNMSYKKVSINKYPYSINKFKENINKIKKETKDFNNNIIFIDEFSFSFDEFGKMYCWSKKNERSHLKIFGNKSRKRKSVILAISKNKIISYKTVNGSVNGELFKEFIMNIIANNDKHITLFMDNARIHHYKHLKTEIEKNNKCKIVYNIPYSPQLNPIEYINNSIKISIKKSGIKDINQLDNVLNKVCKSIKSKKILKCYNHSKHLLLTY